MYFPYETVFRLSLNVLIVHSNSLNFSLKLIFFMISQRYFVSSQKVGEDKRAMWVSFLKAATQIIALHA